MKGKKFYVFLVALLLVGLSAVYFFRQKQSEKYLEFEAYEIENIEKQVAGLYNEEKSDLSKDLSTDQLQTIQEDLEELKGKEYRSENQQRLKNAEEEYLAAKVMVDLQADVEALFIKKGIIEKDLTLEEVVNLEEQVGQFQEKVVYYDRNWMSLEDAKEQVNDIETAISFIDDLFEEDFVRVDVTRENEEEALELIQKIKNEEVREELMTRAEMVNVALTETEEALALEEALAEEAAAQQELEEAEELEQASEQSEQTEWQPNPSGTGNSSGSTGNTNTWRPPTNSSGGGTTSQGGDQSSNSSNEDTTDEVETEDPDSSLEESDPEGSDNEPEDPPNEE